MITFEKFSFRYEEKDEFTLQDISLTVQTGEFVLLTGRSGCGKTTLIRCLNGLIPHFYPGESKGDILLDGQSLLERKPSDLAGKVGTVFQDPRSQFFMTDTTRELAFGCENMGYSREETIDRIAKAALDLKLADYLNRSIFDLSSGEKQQIAIGSVYALLPKVYIFDEPSANLDYAATKRLAEIMKSLKEDGYTIIVVEHRFYYLRELLDRAFLIQDGKLTRTFTKDEFCSLPDETRIRYGLRTVWPERDAGRYQKKAAPREGSCTLKVRNLSFAYKKGPDVLRNISFEAHRGDVIGILGHNGAGKTTLLSIMTGLLKEKTGSICYNEKKLSPRQRRSLSYLVMQDTDYQLFASSVEEELSLGMENDCSGKVAETLEALELIEYRECHPASLSGGQKQRVTIGAAIVRDSPVIYFDEPTSGLDYDSMVRVSRLIEQLADAGVIVFVVSHDFEFITRTCSEVLRLDGQDSVSSQVLTSPEILRSLSKQYVEDWRL
ncbi:ABC transporter ATP-binding protein [Marvinbryantia formatexigens]|nr:energy-coupling factor ABC transporter ATP-binding protein [Marvinbryantia formatexigens]UWO25002.1 energy-coupling factor ABC transporter ATP-binding protein [Marvinbryantia formatexigens DSM 14469]SDG27047.1 energy-coupling factor transport system ATP-binding protein [Marvinbryantia formatexigens]